MDLNPPPVPTYIMTENDLKDIIPTDFGNDIDFEQDIYHEKFRRSDDPSITYD